MPAQQHEWTAEMVRALPDDGRRYEFRDGELLVSPSPTRRHQAVEFWILDIDGRIAERWRPMDDHPEIRTDILDWQPVSSIPALRIDLDHVFG